MTVRVCILALGLLLVSSCSAAAERVALLISPPLDIELAHPPIRDEVAELGAVLDHLGFEVQRLRGANRSTLLTTLREQRQRVAPQGLLLVFYSGDGLLLEGKAYLLAANPEGLRSADRQRAEGVALSEILSVLEAAESRLNLLILDTQFAAPQTGDASGMTLPLQLRKSVLAYSAQPERAVHSLYLRTLIDVLSEQGLSVDALFPKLSARVMADSQGRQVPWQLIPPVWPPAVLAAADGAPRQAVDPTHGRYLVLGDGRLRDTRTQLVWTQSDNGRSFNWQEALHWCAQQNMRLPSIAELETLYLRAAQADTPCGDMRCAVSPLFRLSSFWFWSKDAAEPGKAYTLYLNDGLKHANAKHWHRDARVLCVLQE